MAAETITSTTPEPYANFGTLSQITNVYAGGHPVSIQNLGSGFVDNTSTATGSAGAGIFLTVGATASAGITNDALITGFEYGIEFAATSGGGTAIVSNISQPGNIGTIRATATVAGPNTVAAGVYFGTNVAGTVTNGGLIVGPDGVLLNPQSAQAETVINLAGGTITGTVGEFDQGEGKNAFYGVKIVESNPSQSPISGTATIKNYGVINGLVDARVLNANIVNAGTIQGSTVDQAIFVWGSGTLTIDPGANFGNQMVDFADLTSAGFAAPQASPDSVLILSTTTISPTSTQLTNPGSYIGFGTVDVTSGAKWSIGTVNTTVGIGQAFSGSVLTGGVASSPAITIAAGGLLGVTGTVTDPITVQGTLNVNSAKVTGVLISGTGALAQIYAGGSVTNLNVVSGGDANVVQTGIIIGGTVSSGGTENVGLKNVAVGGSASGTTIGTGGVVNVNQGATATNEIVSGGVLSVTPGGEVFATKVSSGGTEIVSGNGTSGSAIGSGSIIGSGGTEILVSGGIEIPATVSGGHLTAGVGGEVISTTVSAGGTEVISGNGTGSSAIGSGSIIGSGGTEIVISGGTEIPASVKSGGSITAGPGGEVISTAVSSGGSELISGTGAIGSGSIVGPGGTETVISGGTEIPVHILSGGRVTAGPGGELISAQVSSGGTETISGNGGPGTAIGSGSIVGPGGTEIVISGGTEIPANVSGGTLSVGPGGEVISAGVSSGGTEIISGNGSSGSAIGSGSVVGSGGTEILSAGGIEIPGKVNSGGTVVVSSGGVFSGTVSSGGTLSLGVGGSVTTGTVSGAGTYDLGPVYLVSGGYITGLPNNGTGYVVPVGGTEVLASGGFSTATMVNDGAAELVLPGGDAVTTDILSGGTQTVASGGSIGSSTIEGGGTEILSGGALVSGFINFAGSDGTLVIDGQLGATPPNGVLTGFTPGTGNGIVFSGIPYTSGGTVNYNFGVLTVSDGGQTYTLTGVGEPDNSNPFVLVNDGGVLEVIPCYAAGTRILTEEGDRLVEDLAVGDLVVTVLPDGPATRRVVWTGRRAIDIARHPNPAIVRPVRIRAGAFGAGLPERDLRVSPHHAVFLDGALFEALSLVNGTTVIQEQDTRFVTYHHIELDGHDLMLAEGLAAESFLDTGNRDMFESSEGAMQLHADFRTPQTAATCLPIIRDGAALDAARAKLAALAANSTARKAARRA
jgi:autotransporter passenger strand-loop-strand repeat protein